MTRFPHDKFAKDYLEQLLSPLGEVKAPREVRGEARQIDVWFAPKPQPAANPQLLGLLGRFAATLRFLNLSAMQQRPMKFVIVF